MTHDDVISVVEAHRAGKHIQYRFRRSTSDSWDDCSNETEIAFNFHSYDYRVRPEPREWWLMPENQSGFLFRAYKVEQIESPTGHPFSEQIHVREVL